MPTARLKVKSKPGRFDIPELEQFSDMELRQCSPHLCTIYEAAGDLVICDGPCHRQFHCIEPMQESVGCCPGVVIPSAKVADPWLCPDCTSHRARCFQCGIVGTMHSDVRKCLGAYCVRWYCPVCLPFDVASCPIHTCATCQQGYQSESLEDVVQCLRCPLCWHRDCLQHIQGKDVNKTLWGVDRPAWWHTAHDETRWMVYCPKHPLDPTLGTPVHDHISWL